MNNVLKSKKVKLLFRKFRYGNDALKHCSISYVSTKTFWRKI